MIETGAIRGWLLRRPKLVLVRISDDNGMAHEVAPAGEMARVAETIAAMRPNLLEGLDKDGKLVRALRCDDDNDSKRASDAAPMIPAAIAADPHALMITHFANLLHRAYEHSTAVAFSKMVELVQLQNERSGSIETRLERTEANYRRALHDQIDAQFDLAEDAASKAGGEGDAKQAMMEAFIGPFIQAQMANAARPPAPSNGRPNGKGK